jgi:hypothetical protein
MPKSPGSTLPSELAESQVYTPHGYIRHPLLLNATSLTLCVTREDCREQVHRYPHAVFKKVKTLDEAEGWINEDHVGSLPGPEQRGTRHTLRRRLTSQRTVYHRSARQVHSVDPTSSQSTITPTPTARVRVRVTPLVGPMHH